MKTIKNKITTFHWGLQPNFISFKKLSKRLFSNFICFIINNDFYVASLWMHYALFNSVFGRNKVNCYCYLNFPCVRYFEIIYDTFQVCLNPMKVFFDWKGFNVVAITLILNIVVDIGTIYFHWFVIIFFLFTKVRDISCYAVFDFVILFFSLIKFFQEEALWRQNK